MTQQYNFTITVKEVPVMGWCVPIVMELSFGNGEARCERKMTNTYIAVVADK